VVALLEANGDWLDVDRRVLERPEFLTLTQHVCLNHESKPWMVEVHKALFPDWRRIPLQFEDVWQGDGNCSDGQVGTIDDEDTLLILCIHGTLHQWNKIKWVVDVDRLVRSASGMNWRQLFVKAKGLGSKRAVCLGLRLAARCCGTPLAQQCLVEIEKDQSLLGLEQYVFGNWLQPEKFEGSLWRRHRFTLLVRERTADRLLMASANLRVQFYRHVLRVPV
jgi:hypothetical protein